MAEKGYIKKGHVVGGVDPRSNTNHKTYDEVKFTETFTKFVYPIATVQSELITVADKVVSFEMVKGMIAKRFHTCMKEQAESKENKALYFSMSDSELVHTVCRKERLTLFNLMRFHLADRNLVFNIFLY